MKNRIVFLIPYYGQFPNYFSLWEESAGHNDGYDFVIFTDADYTPRYDNIKSVKMTFPELVCRIKTRIDKKCRVSTPYKLCDYKPTYGVVFSEYINGYDFWGFCDIDLILGSINTFVTDQMLDSYDKLFFQGHFGLQRNCEKMNNLFLEKYPNIIDYKTALFTNYSCHFDENGTVAYANEYDKSIRFYFDWTFFDTDFMKYQLEYNGEEVFFRWSNGHLFMHRFEESIGEKMYIHLQKRTMQIVGTIDKGKDYYIARNCFIADRTELNSILNNPSAAEAKEYSKKMKKKLLLIRAKKLRTGWVKIKFLSITNKWRGQKDLNV